MSNTLFTLYNGSNACYFNSAIQVLSRCIYLDHNDYIVKIIRYLQSKGNTYKTEEEKEKIINYINNMSKVCLDVDASYKLDISNINYELVNLMINLMSETNRNLFTISYANNQLIDYIIFYYSLEVYFDEFDFRQYNHNQYSLCYTGAQYLKLIIKNNDNFYKLTSVVYNPSGHFITCQLYEKWFLIDDNNSIELIEHYVIEGDYYNVYNTYVTGSNVYRVVLALYVKQAEIVNPNDVIINKLTFSDEDIIGRPSDGFKRRMTEPSEAIPFYIDEKTTNITSNDFGHHMDEPTDALVLSTGDCAKYVENIMKSDGIKFELIDDVQKKLTEIINKEIIRVQTCDPGKVHSLIQFIINNYIFTLTYIIDVINGLITVPDFVNWFINYYNYLDNADAIKDSDFNNLKELYEIIIYNVGKNENEYRAVTNNPMRTDLLDKRIIKISKQISVNIIKENITTSGKIIYYFNNYLRTMIADNTTPIFQYNDNVLYFNSEIIDNVDSIKSYTKFRELVRNNKYEQVVYIKVNTLDVVVNPFTRIKHEDIINYYKTPSTGEYVNYLISIINRLMSEKKIILSQEEIDCLIELNIPMLILYMINKG